MAKIEGCQPPPSRHTPKDPYMMPVVTRSKARAATAARMKELNAAYVKARAETKPPLSPLRPVAPKSTEQKLQEALAEIASLKKTNASLTKWFVEYMNERTRIIADTRIITDKIGEVWDAKRKIKELEEELKMSQARK